MHGTFFLVARQTCPTHGSSHGWLSILMKISTRGNFRLFLIAQQTALPKIKSRHLQWWDAPVRRAKARIESIRARNISGSASITRAWVWQEVLEFIRLTFPLLGIGWGCFFHRNIWPDF